MLENGDRRLQTRLSEHPSRREKPVLWKNFRQGCLLVARMKLQCFGVAPAAAPPLDTLPSLAILNVTESAIKVEALA
jgi:hypothetical protein